jgi:hypothetical protein
MNSQFASLSIVGGLLAFACLGASQPKPLPEGVVAKVPGDQRPVTIVKTELSDDKSDATVWFTSSLGIFAFTFEPGDLPLKTVRFIIQEQKYCEGLTFSPKTGGELDLRHFNGVQVTSTNGNLNILVRAPAIDQLKPGGRIQYVNQYR